ncbi:MAG: hypothetical protein OQJ98_01160 [Candidatus Pacebacteria bacterium]|nr:hypothetical protein [Candidatus Paceibacterota bacterium]
MSERAIEVIPAIMPESVADLTEKVRKIVGLVRTVQIDIMDGVFVPEKTWPYIDDETRPEELPYWDEVAYEVDLMVKEPEEIIDTWLGFEVARIIIHIESTEKLQSIMRHIEAYDERTLVTSPTEIGISLNVETPNDAIAPYEYDVDFVQCMGIARIGYQGEPFDERVIEKIRDLRRKYPHLIISVDGGVSLESAPKLIEAGAERLVSGSSVFESPDIQATIEKLKQK